MLTCDITHQLGAFKLACAFTAGPGITALFGQSGSGKTTIIKAIAGLIRPDHGRLSIDGVRLFDSQSGIFKPPHERRIGTVFQDSRLFPHLTVEQNLLYGRRFNPAVSQGATLDHVATLLGLTPLLSRKPRNLSGGEQQRTAIGRALLSNPSLLLLDEPFAALDSARKHEVMPYLEALRETGLVPIIYVSHAIDEVLRLATDMVLIDAGRVAASGPITEVMQRLDMTHLIGEREAGALFAATVVSHDPRYGLTLLTSPAGLWRVPMFAAASGAAVQIRIRASDVMLSSQQPSAVSALNIFPATVTEIGRAVGPSIEVKLDCNGCPLIARLTRYSSDQMKLAPGLAVFALIKSVVIGSAVRTGSVGPKS